MTKTHSLQYRAHVIPLMLDETTKEKIHIYQQYEPGELLEEARKTTW